MFLVLVSALRCTTARLAATDARATRQVTLEAKWEASEPGAQTTHESSHENGYENKCENKHENCDRKSHENFLHRNIVGEILIRHSATVFVLVFTTLVFIPVFMAGFMLLVVEQNGYLVCNLLEPPYILFLFKMEGRVVVHTRLLVRLTLECVFIKKTHAWMKVIFMDSSQGKPLS